MAIRSKAGKLFLDFRWRGVRCREFTGLADTSENRRKLRAFDQIVKGEIAFGTFDYRKHFPNGARISELYGEQWTIRGARHRLISEYLMSGTSGARLSFRTAPLQAARIYIRQLGCTTSPSSDAT